MSDKLTQFPTISNAQFLEGIFGECYNAAHVTGFSEDPGQLDTLGKRHYWGGNAWYLNNLEDPGFNNFFTISTFYQDEDGRHYRRKANFAAAFCMMIDDIGTGPGAKISPVDMMFIGHEPSWKLETSPENFQYGYIFESPVTDRHAVEALLKGLVALDLVDGGGDPGMLGCTRYARLPIGGNTKAAYGSGFTHLLHEWRPDRRYGIDDLASSFGIRLRDFYQPDTYPDARPIEDDLVYQSLDRLGLVKAKLREGIYDIVCPWMHEHTDGLDNGAAYLSPMGFKCHHGHCATRTGRDLLNYLHGADSVYADACKIEMPFESAAPEIAPQRASEGVSEGVDLSIEDAIKQINPADPGTTQAAYRALAIQYLKLSPTEREHYMQMIKRESAVTIKVVRDQLKYTRAMLLKEHREKGILQEPAWKDFYGENIVGTLENFRAVCEYHGITMKHNQMTHDNECDIPGRMHSGEDTANLDLAYMRDLVQTYGIAFSRVGEWMNSYARDNEYHPFRDYLDSLSDDLFDPMCPAFYKLLDTLKFDRHDKECEMFVRRWLISVVAAVRGHGGAGLKGVLTFVGDQGIGKTSWFRNLFPGNGMFGEGLVLDPHNKDTLIKATGHLVCELGEVDATFKKDIPALKAFISNQTDEIRHPYAAKMTVQKRRTVFCATVNSENFLVDQTGNSRFWPVPLASCDFMAVAEMGRRGELDRLWKELDHMYQAAADGRPEFRWWIGIEEMGDLSKVSEDFIRMSQGEQLLKECFDMEAPAVHWMTIQEIMQALGVDTRAHNANSIREQVTATIRRITGQRQTEKFTRGDQRPRGYRMPQRVLKKMSPQLSVVATVGEKKSVEDFL